MTAAGSVKKAAKGAVEKTATDATGARRPARAEKRKSGVGEFDIDSITGKWRCQRRARTSDMQAYDAIA